MTGVVPRAVTRRVPVSPAVTLGPVRRLARRSSCSSSVACTSTDPQVTRGTSVESPRVVDVGLPDADGGARHDRAPSDTESDDTTDARGRARVDRLARRATTRTIRPRSSAASSRCRSTTTTRPATTITLALTRLPATGDAAGFDPAEPGRARAVGQRLPRPRRRGRPRRVRLRSASRSISSGFDPRGVGESSPIDCVDDAWLDSHEFDDPTPDTPEETGPGRGVGDGVRQPGCVDNTTGDLAEYDTLNTARDMDRIREAVGDDRLTFYGASYGTFLGGRLRDALPRQRAGHGARRRRLPDRSRTFFESNRIQLLGFEKAFGNWAADCEAERVLPVPRRRRVGAVDGPARPTRRRPGPGQGRPARQRDAPSSTPR